VNLVKSPITGHLNLNSQTLKNVLASPGSIGVTGDHFLPFVDDITYVVTVPSFITVALGAFLPVTS
jgi:hypothetical protein